MKKYIVNLYRKQFKNLSLVYWMGILLITTFASSSLDNWISLQSSTIVFNNKHLKIFNTHDFTTFEHNTFITTILYTFGSQNNNLTKTNHFRFIGTHLPATWQEIRTETEIQASIHEGIATNIKEYICDPFENLILDLEQKYTQVRLF